MIVFIYLLMGLFVLFFFLGIISENKKPFFVAAGVCFIVLLMLGILMYDLILSNRFD